MVPVQVLAHAIDCYANENLEIHYFCHMLVSSAKWLTIVERLPYNLRVGDSVHLIEQLLHADCDVCDAVEHFESRQSFAVHCGCVISWNVCHLLDEYCWWRH